MTSPDPGNDTFLRVLLAPTFLGPLIGSQEENDTLMQRTAGLFLTELQELRAQVSAELAATFYEEIPEDLQVFIEQATLAIETMTPTFDAAVLAAIQHVFMTMAANNQVIRPSEILDVPRDRLLYTLNQTGPLLIKEMRDKGYPPEQAQDIALRRTILAGQQIVTDQANYQGQEVVKANRRTLQGHRRVANPGACGFCRLLAGGANKYPVYNATDKWKRPHPNCHCVIVPINVFRTERIRSMAEIEAGRALYRQIKAAKDRAKARGEVTASTARRRRGPVPEAAYGRALYFGPDFRPTKIA